MCLRTNVLCPLVLQHLAGVPVFQKFQQRLKVLWDVDVLISFRLQVELIVIASARFMQVCVHAMHFTCTVPENSDIAQVYEQRMT